MTRRSDEMNSPDEFTLRALIFAEARRLFIETGRTKSISEAAQLYRELYPEKCAGARLTTTVRDADRPQTILDQYERPPCPKCGKPLFFHACQTCRKGPVKKNEWKCKRCGYRRITKDTLEEALAKLERKEDHTRD